MGAAFETIAGHATGQTGVTTYAASTMATGDSLVVRNFPAANPAYLMALIMQDAEAYSVRVRSPLLHDNVMGIHFSGAETPSEWMLGAPGVQPLKPQDTLILEMAGVGTPYRRKRCRCTTRTFPVRRHGCTTTATSAG